MIQSGEFWCVLGVSVVIFWLLPQRFRVIFLALISVGYVALQGWRWALVLLGWTALFYFLAPLAAVARKEAVLRGQRRSKAAARAATESNAPQTATLVIPEPQPQPSPRQWILPLLIAAIVGYLAWFKYLQNIPRIQSILGHGPKPIKLAIP